MTRKRILTTFFAGCFAIAFGGLIACRSAFIEATLRNDGDVPLRLVEVDYPSATFGIQTLNAHSAYHYRFKVQGSGAVTLTYTGFDGRTHSATGPTLDEGQHGDLIITVDQAGKINWGEALIRTK
jgi:hypothetical protein